MPPAKRTLLVLGGSMHADQDDQHPWLREEDAFLRQLLERQAVRRMEGGTLTDEEVERMGLALMRLEQKVHEMARAFGLDPSELNLGLGPLGRLV